MTTTTPVIPDSTSRPRLHGLDALRAGALLLGIVLHSLMPFIPGMPWMVTDSSNSPVAAFASHVIHVFRMPLFMLLAGYFARMSLLRKGTGAFVKDRLKRIGLPLIAFWPIAVLPLAVLTAVSYLVRGLAVPTARPEEAGAMISPGQLWFLLVLLECYLIVLILRAVLHAVLGAERCQIWAERLAGVLTSPAGVLLALLPYAAAMLLHGNAGGGIPQPMSFVPEPYGLIGFFGAFGIGWLFHARSDALGRLSGGRWIQLGLAVVATVASFLLTGATGALSVLNVLLVALAGWSWIYALLGLAVRQLDRERPAVRYLADASYWMYLLHLPVVLAVEIPLADLGIPIIVKLVINWVVSFAVLVLSYHLLVRSTWIGRWLNGRKYPWTWPPLRSRR